MSHYWGDENVDWKGISDAAEFIATNLRRWGRIPVYDYKEKWGEVRVSCQFGWTSILHDMFFPGWAVRRIPKWVWDMDVLYLSKLCRLINIILIPYQEVIYLLVYSIALKKWPHLREEILQGAGWSELLGRLGVHSVRTGKGKYTVYYDWHPDNFSDKYPDEGVSEGWSEEPSKGPIKWIKREQL